MGGALSGQSSRQTETGYEKSAIENGNAVSETWDNTDKSGSYSTVIASRFAVSAEGDAPSIDTLKQAVGSVDAGKLAALARSGRWRPRTRLLRQGPRSTRSEEHTSTLQSLMRISSAVFSMTKKTKQPR